eukprot:846486-Rhodomonas_salina.1
MSHTSACRIAGARCDAHDSSCSRSLRWSVHAPGEEGGERDEQGHQRAPGHGSQDGQRVRSLLPDPTQAHTARPEPAS